MVLETLEDILLEMFHVSRPCFIVAVCTAKDDEAPFVVLCVNHAFDCGGERLARPVEAVALFYEPFKLGRRHFSGWRASILWATILESQTCSVVEDRRNYGHVRRENLLPHEHQTPRQTGEIFCIPLSCCLTFGECVDAVSLLDVRT